jgi:hypothetical protein
MIWQGAGVYADSDASDGWVHAPGNLNCPVDDLLNAWQFEIGPAFDVSAKRLGANHKRIWLRAH